MDDFIYLFRDLYSTLVEDNDYKHRCIHCVFKCCPSRISLHPNGCSEYVLDGERYLAYMKGVKNV